MLGRPSLMYITAYDVARAPHAEWLPYILSRAGWEVEVVGPNASAGVVRQTLAGAWRTTNLPTAGRLRPALSLLRHLLRGRFARCDVVCVDSLGVNYLAAPLFVGPRFSTRLVYQNRDFVDPLRHPLRSRLEGLLARRCDLHVNHEYHRAYFLRTLHRMRCPAVLLPPYLPKVWPIPPFSHQVREQLTRNQPDAFVLRLHGGFGRLRATDQLLAAMRMLPDRIRLAMTDCGDRDRGSALVESLGLRHRVVLLAPTGFNSMLRYTVCSDAGVLLYDNNDLGNFFQAPGRLTEYLACGLPLLAANFTGLQNLIRHHKIGVCVDPSDPSSIAEGILELERGRRAGEFAPNEIRRIFEERFTLERYVTPVKLAFELLCGSEEAR